MTDRHLTRDLLLALVATDSLAELLPLILVHLSEICPRCAQELHQMEVDLASNPAAPADYEAILRGVLEAVETRTPARPADTPTSDRWLALLRLPERDRCKAVRRQPQIYGRLELAERLLAACRAKLPGQPREILALTTLARCILRHTPDGTTPEPQIARETYALAMAHHGNALKVLGQLEAAASLLSDARYWLGKSGSIDPMVEAEIDCLEGSLFSSQRRFPAASQLLSRAAETWREVGETDEEGKALLALAMVERQLDHHDLCQNLIQEALECFEETRNVHLATYAWHNLAFCLCESGQYREAKSLVAERRNWYDSPSAPLTQLRLLWVDAKIACGLGDEERGEEIFQSVRNGFADLDLPYDSALAALELTSLFLRQGRTAEVKQLVAEMVEVFDERDIHRETIASLILFRDAVELEQVSAASLRELSTYLERARRDPNHAFRIPS